MDPDTGNPDPILIVEPADPFSDKFLNTYLVSCAQMRVLLELIGREVLHLQELCDLLVGVVEDQVKHLKKEL